MLRWLQRLNCWVHWTIQWLICQHPNYLHLTCQKPSCPKNGGLVNGLSIVGSVSEMTTTSPSRLERLRLFYLWSLRLDFSSFSVHVDALPAVRNACGRRFECWAFWAFLYCAFAGLAGVGSSLPRIRSSTIVFMSGLIRIALAISYCVIMTLRSAPISQKEG